MISYFKFLISKNKLILTYCIIGITSVAIDIFIFNFCYSVLSLNYLLSNLISVHFGILNSFILNRNFNFKVKNKLSLRLMIFYLVGFLGIGVSSFILYISIHILNLKVGHSKIASIIIVSFFQYYINSRVTFKIKKNE